MILVDTSIWIDHLHRRDSVLALQLENVAVSTHPMVIGELALGSIRDRTTFLDYLDGLPRLRGPDDAELLIFVEHHHLYGRGLSLIAAHLLASVALAPGSTLWTRDKTLDAAARELQIAFRAAS